ncbi:cell division protein FtsZ [Alteromonas sp. KS69]|jgi:cell division protein FtsZ|uniref:Cell division protein FtsZ n=1 Tax=Alteromonas naphthalenivorans TaxID=715451 RepID=F5ZBS1_ALTNA|nr:MULTISPECIES: cell division protein FtsZ [Alteromonas]MBB67254.1 cell division protein FtsZ [Rickettsiales bacterium]PHS54444.1 MAG: cell division protein FtsZ [Alteromonas sp.]AEF02000.1 cell division protein FtsZ [Alteromonas naphthalenivorans]MBQ4830923.1 cell division protein FtsZ [Alteromonas sp. MMG017]MCQ8848278.1 cell division protein FtsZ [Alteromonas stellipolaris]|tara:strand:- start:1675 stop:2844 length:1170 start_codon:yes stop_codon:yes gene_type:complete|mmetsp:Transcript_33562/g.88146  ORF Transcript_33562/g.88146 Transcript_33562/m.88146 type:complete len:390 (+) Transcript_33562:435-1604(+)|eukprot:CAMPEP_0182935392 /NCGR_PEP_ID=MMETSP0105_2-20130417/38105_1 /TAXON_ID=81532 ORGANISM="Acanthoeca-like sp., Strain 10tr" /NCGR_SAMPLE_ID=MMETSP0105_2 /ASSEMBLY_ACC=CAM_ASM_000205 /LENGTH=389 /DNA_ID=CAMNT_0025074371 /DNA_START=428 /DNA_END=1597 /DNA_ORIENTATION=+
MFELMDSHGEEAVIKVIGVGGGGGNAVEHMVSQSIEGVEFIAINTDAQVLRSSNADVTLQIGSSVTKGLGAGADPNIGRDAAHEDRETIRQALDGADMVFITAGMGGGTGTGAAPEVAKIAREMGILTVAVVTKPFPFEGKKRTTFAEQGIVELANNVDSLITIPNEKLLKVMGPGTPLLQAFSAANDVLRGAVQGIAELITRPGLINVDFADVRTVMSEMGKAMMGSGSASGPDRAEEASESAIASPLLEDIDLSGARGILVNITAGPDFAIDEFETVGNAVKAFASENATVVVGTVIDMEMTDELRVTVVATGIGAERKPDISLVSSEGSRLTTPAKEYGSTTASEPRSASVGSTEGNQALKAEDEAQPGNDLEYLDIPAFLRKQAD